MLVVDPALGTADPVAAVEQWIYYVLSPAHLVQRFTACCARDLADTGAVIAASAPVRPFTAPPSVGER